MNVANNRLRINDLGYLLTDDRLNGNETSLVLEVCIYCLVKAVVACNYNMRQAQDSNGYSTTAANCTLKVYYLSYGV